MSRFKFGPEHVGKRVNHYDGDVGVITEINPDASEFMQMTINWNGSELRHFYSLYGIAYFDEPVVVFLDDSASQPAPAPTIQEFTPGQYVRVRSDKDEPWQDIRIYVQKQGGLHYVTKAGEVRHTYGDATEGFLYCITWVPEVGELVLWQSGNQYYYPASVASVWRDYVTIKPMNSDDMPYKDVQHDMLIPYYLPPFKPAPHG